MAREIFTLVGRITSEGFEKVFRNLKKVDKGAAKLAKDLNIVGKKMERVGRNITKMAVPLIALGAAVTKFGADFEKAMVNSLAIMGDVSGAMRNDMEMAARSVAKVTKFSATQAAEAYFFLASAGKTAAQAIELLPQVAKFAQAGNFDLALATDLLTDAQSALGLSSKDVATDMKNMAKVSDVLVKANTIANATVQQFSESLTNKAGAALRVLGKDLEEGAAVLAVYADQGVKGADAGTQLNIVLRDLQVASINNRKAFDDANVAVFDSAGEMRNLADIIADLENRLLGMSDEQKRAELQLLGFTSKSISATIALLGASDAIKGYEEALRSAGGITEEVANKQIQNFWDQLGLIKDRLIDVGLTLWDSLGPALMDSILPALENFVDKLASLANWFNELNPAIKKFSVGLTLFAISIGPVLIGVGSLLQLLKFMRTTIIALKGAILLLNTALLSNPFFLAAAGITAIGFAIAKTSKEWEKWQDNIEEDIAQKQATQLKSDLEELIVLYNELALANRQAMGEERFSEVSKKIKELEKNVGDAGIALEGSFVARAEKAENILTDLELAWDGTTKSIVDFTETEKVAGKASEEQSKKLLEQRKAFNEKSKAEFEKAKASELELINIAEQEEIAAAEKIGASKEFILKKFDAKRQEVFDKEFQARQEIVDQYDKEVEASLKALDIIESAQTSYFTALETQAKMVTATKLELIDMEIQAETDRALELLGSTEEFEEAKALIEEIHRERKLEAEIEQQDKINQLKQGALAFQKVLQSEEVQTIVNGINQIFSVASQNTQNKLTLLDQEKEKRIGDLDEERLSEEEFAKEKAEIEEDIDKKRKKLQLKQAKRDKAAALFSTGIAIATGIAKSLPNLILAAIVGAIGLVQLGVIAAKPLPKLAKGGIIPGSERGMELIAGEKNKEELIMPLQTGIDKIVSALFDSLTGAILPSQPSRPAIAGVGSPAAGRGGITNIFNIDTLIASDSQMLNLERTLLPHRVAEQQRKGESA